MNTDQIILAIKRLGPASEGRRLSRAMALAIMVHGAGLAATGVAVATDPKIVLIGATSRTGAELIPQALALGYDVLGVARRPDEVKITHDRLRVVKGDVTDILSLEAALRGDEVVISMVGPKPTLDATQFRDFGPTDLVSQGTANIIQAMKKKGNRRLIVASSSLAEIVPIEGPPPSDAAPYLRYLWSMRTAYQDDRDMEAIVRVSGLEHVILRPGFLIAGPALNNIQLAVSAQGREGLTPKRTIVTYADLAGFTLRQVKSDEFIGKTVGIYSDVCPKGTELKAWGCVDR